MGWLMKIGTKSFMEFFKEEFNIDFIEQETGRNALDIIKENERKRDCLSCHYAMAGDGRYLHEEDTICINNKSEYVTDWVSDEMICDLWEKGGELDE